MNPSHNYCYFVYLLRSKKNGSFHIGCTNNLKERLKKHNNKQNVSTARYTPWKCIYLEGFISKTDAFMRKKSLKRHATRFAQTERTSS